MRKSLSAAMAILLLACSSQAAEVIRGKWQKVDLIPSGTPIILKAANGERMECTYISSDREMLLIVETSGNPRRIRKSEVESIIAEKYEDRLFNGAVIGLSAGVAAALLTAAASPEINNRDRAGFIAFGSVLFGLAGMCVGTLVDSHHKGRELIYLAPNAVEKLPVR